ncbi:MAG: hypothetical protein MUP71_04700 [Candidatus Aminicenantes bacterium]|nr:hypothetical protein [Candidatus Aminicenantes bacterium]
MKEVVLQIPTMEAEQNIEIEVRINGRKKTLHYRVEIVNWENTDPTSEDKVRVLRKVIREHDHDWQLVTIGSPTESNIPVMFRRVDADENARQN